MRLPPSSSNSGPTTGVSICTRKTDRLLVNGGAVSSNCMLGSRGRSRGRLLPVQGGSRDAITLDNGRFSVDGRSRWLLLKCRCGDISNFDGRQLGVVDGLTFGLQQVVGLSFSMA